MENKKKIISYIALVIGIALSIASISHDSLQSSAILFCNALGISLMTTSIMGLYEFYLSDRFKNKIKIKDAGMAIDKKINFEKCRNIDLLFHSGSSTLKKHSHDFINAIKKNNCQLRIVITNPFVVKDDAMNTALCRTINIENEIQETIQIFNDIHEELRRKGYHGKGTMQLFLAPHYPTCSIEIIDNQYCIVVPYIPYLHSQESYFLKYKQGDEVFQLYQDAFDNVLSQSTSYYEFTF